MIVCEDKVTMFTLARELDLFLANLVIADTTNSRDLVEFHAFFMSLRGRPTTYNGQRSRNLSKQRADYFPQKAFRVEGKQINFKI
jgi:hypothetical protein